ncbi:MAG TPA: hypothetical protein VK750_05205 [Cytophagaceae bacterium]|jgi:hypothetical protein|nr:hypothetical protein [Cytophagaceae bacterium]
MNKTFTLLLALCLMALNLKAQDDLLSKHAPELRKIFKTEKGVFRGFNFGDTRAAIKATEDALLQGEGKDFMVYKTKLDENEYAEIMFTFDEQDKVKMFGIAFIENVNLTAEERMLDDFQAYFTQKYGKFTINSKNDEVWSSSDGYVIEMGDSSDGKSDLLEIEVEIFKK